MKLKLFISTLLIILLYSCSNQQNSSVAINPEKESKPLNVILLIGDGMGLSAASSAFYYSDGEPNIGRFNNIGLINTSSASHKITDSGAGGTAFAIGEKTYNSAIGVGVDSLARKNLVEILSEQSYATGIVVSCQLPHATPASFYAHVKSRYQYEDIAKQFVYSDIDYYAGGGYKYFNQRSDSINYMDSLKHYGFSVDTNGLKEVSNEANDSKMVYLLASNAMKPMSEGRADFLPKATNNALNYLDKNKDGFFLMVEGSQIDWEGHANNGEALIQEVLDFDKTIGIALDYAEKNGNTLVIVLADHETGGFTLAAGTSNTAKKYGNYDVIKPAFSTNEHSTSLIPVYAWGPGSENFRGIYQNNDIFKKILQEVN